MTARLRNVFVFALSAGVLIAAGCSSDSSGHPGSSSAAPTATPTLVATATPTTVPTATPTTVAATGLSALVVVRQDLAANNDDGLAPPPEGWEGSPDGKEFDRALSQADWHLSGPVAASGATSDDGTFAIDDLPPGHYVLDITKTLNGNLVTAAVPFAVGETGTTDVVIEIGRGEVRTTSRYADESGTVEEIRGPNGSYVAIEAGRLVELGDHQNLLIDADGDGFFLPQVCPEQLWLCDEGETCGPDRRCSCTASCPSCDDCGPGVCAPPLPFPPYRCNDAGACEIPGDRCVCVSSCPDCRDCALSVCVPSCDPVTIEEVRVEGPATLVVGRSARLRAVTRLDNGTAINATHVVSWESSDEDVLQIDNWGTVQALSAGTASVTASLADVRSAPFDVEVVDSPPLRRIFVRNLSCIFPTGIPGRDIPPPDFIDPGFSILPPDCHDVVRIGRTVQLSAFGEFADGTHEEITRRTEWQLSPPAVGTVVAGLFTAEAEGVAGITASLDGVTSEPYEIRVVTQPTIVDLSIHANNATSPPFFRPVFEDDPVAADFPDFCFECGIFLTVLSGDELHFTATARFDTGEWEDVTELVTWRSNDSSVASIDAAGVMTAVAAGEAVIDATLDDVDSNPIDVRVVDEATLTGLSIFQDGLDRVVGKGEQAFFRAHGYYDIGFSRDLTEEATWHSSDESVGEFDLPGAFTGRNAGNVQVWAELDGVESNRLPMEVFETGDIDYCDAENVNRGIWEDAFNRVVLESDCALYAAPAVATLRFTVTERERPAGIFDPCLDLFVFKDGQRVRTIREEGCGEPFLAPGAPEFDRAQLRYQLLAFWDLKDDRGNLVPPGRYTVHGRFYLYFDPVVSIDIGVTAPDGRIPCTENDCGNGCGYVPKCGDTEPPLACPAVCMPLCECPPGWGITAENDCEPCPPQDCCTRGALCGPLDPPPCPLNCCLGAEGCDPTLALCEPQCCPANATCLPGIPRCDDGPRCCPQGSQCPADLPPCELECCPPNARCTPDVPPCETDIRCCPPGQACVPELPPCPVESAAGVS